MLDAEAIGKIAEGAGKVVGVGWLIGHHGRNALKTWRAKQAKKKVVPAPELDEQLKFKEAEAEEGRLIRNAVFSGMEQAQKIEDLGRQLSLKDQEIAAVCRERDQFKELSEQYRLSASDWQREAADWRQQAKTD